MDPALDPAFGPEEILTQRAFLKRLARGLLGDELLAEDVVQEVELRALERPPGTKENLAGWLVAVTRNLARNSLRAHARRERHERAAARGELVPSHADVLEGLDLQRHVLEAVRALREPYRTAVWLRYYEERTPSEIAERTGTPLATVKTRLRRALAELRAELDRAAGERRAWVALLAPLARETKPVIGTVAGVLAMKKLAVVLVVAALGWIGWRSTRSAERVPALGEAEVAAEDVVVGGEARVPAAPVVEREREPLLAAQPLEGGSSGTSLEVRLRWADGAGAADVGLTLWRGGDTRPELSARTAVSDAEGRARLDGLAPGSCTLHLDRDRDEALELAAGEARVLELTLAAGVDVAGTVVDGTGATVAGAEIWLEGRGAGLLGGRAVARSSEDGTFFLRGLGPEQALAAHDPEHAPSALERLRDKVLAVGGEGGERVLHLRLRLGPERDALAGVVLDELERPVAGALVAVGSWGNDSLQGRDGRWLPQVKARVLVCDAAGRFRTTWVDPTVAPVHALAPGHALARAFGRGAGHELEIRLVRGATIEGVVRGPTGEPSAGVEVVASAGDVGQECPFPLPRARTDAAGAYRLEHVPPGEVVLECSARDVKGLRARAEGELADGAFERWDLELRAGLAITGRALDREGKPIPGALLLVDRGQGRSLRSIDADGRFTLTPSDPEQRHDLVLVVAGSERARRDGVRAGDVVELVASAGSGAIFGLFVDAGGRVRPGEKVGARLATAAEGPVSPVADIGADGTFVFPDLVPGRYRLAIQSEGVEVARGDWFELGDGERRDLGEIASLPGGSVVVEFLTPAGEPCFPGAWIWNEDGTMSRSLGRVGERWCAGALEPGRYRLFASGLHLAEHDEELEIRAGVETRLTVTLRPAVGRRLAVTAPAGASYAKLEVVVRDVDSGETVAKASAAEELLWLPVGRFELEATTDTGLRGEVRIEVPDLGLEYAPVEVVLR